MGDYNFPNRDKDFNILCKTCNKPMKLIISEYIFTGGSRRIYACEDGHIEEYSSVSLHPFKGGA